MSQKTAVSAPKALPPTTIPMAFVRTTTLDVWCYAELLAGEWVTVWGQHTLARLQEKYADMELMSVAAFINLQNEKYRTPVREITQERYIDQLEVLPPMDWSRSNTGESFKSREVYAGDVTSIFVRMKGCFFEFRDVCTLTHTEVMARVEKEMLPGGARFSGH